MTSKLDDVIGFQQSALKLRAHRQQSLAGNVANADTPNDKARDIDLMDVERTQFADNAIHYEANLAFISSQLKTLLAAIQG